MARGRWDIRNSTRRRSTPASPSARSARWPARSTFCGRCPA